MRYSDDFNNASYQFSRRHAAICRSYLKGSGGTWTAHLDTVDADVPMHGDR